ncbi:MAG: DNA polymerase I [Deltaproteobacteria bacterium]|jgi:DNA polymerase-1|nr:DNA polymerase I [Deltaproteobacteria bacterium]
MPDRKTVYLMDASAFIHRAYHALPNFSASDGRPTGAIFGFVNSLLRLIKDKAPAYMGVAFDGKSSADSRKALYAEYKANRPPMDRELATQMPPIHGIVEALGLTSMELPGHEADDLIAAYARKFQAEGHPVVIVSGDKDFYQLLSDKVSMYDPDPGKKSALDMEGFERRFPGVEPKGFLEMQALMGDSSDNIPGVRKVGEKTALKLIQDYKDLDRLYKNLHHVRSESIRASLEENKDNAYLSRRLAYLGEGVGSPMGLEDFRVKAPDKGRLLGIFKDYEFARLSRDLQAEFGAGKGGPDSHPGPGGNAHDKEHGEGRDKAQDKAHDKPENIPEDIQPQAPKAARAPRAGKPKGPFGGLGLFGGDPVGPGSALVWKGHGEKVDRGLYSLVQGEGGWEELLGELRKAERLAIDLETDSPRPSSANIVGISLATADNRAFYVPVAHRRLLAGETNLDAQDALARLKGPLLAKGKRLCGQNAKFDWLILARHGLRLPAPEGDPMLASYLLDPDDRHDLDHLSAKFLGHRAISYREMVPDKKGRFEDVGLGDALRYSGEDSDLTLRLVGVLDKELGTDKPLLALYRKVELPLEDLLVSMEQAGILVDKGMLKGISEDLSHKLDGLAKSIYKIAGEDFNISSPKQVGRILFEKMGIPSVKKTSKTKSYSTDNDVLASLAPNNEIARLLIEYRELSKLKNTYADKLPLSVNPQTKRIHTSFNQTLTATGRLSSSDPNLQNIPARTEEGRRIREAFLASEGSLLVSADYSQIELRVMAEFSQDKALLKAFHEDEDIHRETAAHVFGVSPKDVTAEERRKAKAINFGIIYGQGPFGLGKVLGIPQGEAKDFINLYFRRFPGVRLFMEETQKDARSSQMVRTLFGRRRFLRNIVSGNHQLKSEAERIAINTPIQGTAADLIKIAMLRVENRLRKEGLKARILLQVHDELIVEAPETESEKVRELLKEEMSKAGSEPFFPGAKTLRVPLKVDTSVSRRWTHA